MVDKTNLISPPLNLLPPGEERFLAANLKLLETKSQISLCKNLRLVRDFARERRPLRSSRSFVGSASPPT